MDAPLLYLRALPREYDLEWEAVEGPASDVVREDAVVTLQRVWL